MYTQILSDIQNLDDSIRDTIVDPDGACKVILDGIVNPEKYFGSKYKILWILKEANDTKPNEEGIVGDWDLRGFISKGVIEYTNWKKTYLPIAYSVWGILNDFCLWENMDDYDNDPSMLDILKNIAIINVKKLPGGSTSNENEISRAYKKYRELLLRQINLYRPDILIFGGTIHHFMEDLSIPSESLYLKGYHISDNRIFIKNYHPNQRIIKQKEYCNHNINAAKKFIENYKG